MLAMQKSPMASCWHARDCMCCAHCRSQVHTAASCAGMAMEAPCEPARGSWFPTRSTTARLHVGRCTVLTLPGLCTAMCTCSISGCVLSCVTTRAKACSDSLQLPLDDVPVHCAQLLCTRRGRKHARRLRASKGSDLTTHNASHGPERAWRSVRAPSRPLVSDRFLCGCVLVVHALSRPFKLLR